MKKIYSFLKTTIINLIPFIIFFLCLVVLFKFLNQKVSDTILEYLKIISWPLSFIISILLFRQNLSRLIDRIKGLSTPFGSVDTSKLEEQQNNFDDEELSLKRIPENIIIEKEAEIRAELEQKYGEVVKDYQENYEKDRNNLINELSIRDLYLDFERTYNVIFGSQIALLRILMAQMSIGESRAFLELYFQGIKQKFLASFTNWTVDNYISFLINKNLIDTGNGMYKITEKGINFLSYIVTLGYSENKML